MASSNPAPIYTSLTDVTNFDLSEDDVIQFCEHVYDPDAM
jgi:hypothetical protein